MKVWQFSESEMMDMPTEKAGGYIFYTGTHDNRTLAGWCSDFCKGVESPISKADEIIEKLYASSSPWVIIQLQDMLGLGDEARTNTPGTIEGNWEWRMKSSEFSPLLARKYRKLAEEHER